MTPQEIYVVVLTVIGLCCTAMYLCVRVAILRIQHRQKLLNEKPKINKRSWSSSAPKPGQIVSDGQLWGVVTGVSPEGRPQISSKAELDKFKFKASYENVDHGMDAMKYAVSAYKGMVNNSKWQGLHCHHCKCTPPHGAQFCPNCGKRTLHLSMMTENRISGSQYEIIYHYQLTENDHV